MPMFITKYALTAGIQERDDLNVREDGFAYGKPGFESFKVGRDCFHTREEAATAAEAVRLKRIASLESQIAKLRELTF